MKKLCTVCRKRKSKRDFYAGRAQCVACYSLIRKLKYGKTRGRLPAVAALLTDLGVKHLTK